jgi:hypothetical protein
MQSLYRHSGALGLLITALILGCGAEKESSNNSGGAGASGTGTGGTTSGAGGSGAGGTTSGTGGSSSGASGTGTGGSSTATANFTVNVSLSPAIATVGIVEWSIDKTIESARIEFGRDASAFEFTAPADLMAPSYRTLLLGMKASTTYSLRVVAQGGGQTYASNVYTVQTGFLPNGLPVQTITDRNAAALYAGGGFTVGCTGFDTFSDVGADPTWVFIFDKDGDQVWALDMSDTAAAGCTRARMSLDGKYMWAGSFGNTTADGALSRVTMDGMSTPQDYVLPGRSHDFAILPNDHIAYFARNNGGAGQAPESVFELDPATSQTTKLWDPTGVFTFEDDRGGHANQINYVPELNALSLSMYFINTVALISYPQGQLLAAFGGDQSTFNGMSWDGQHGHDVRADRVSIFNNNGSNGGASVLRFQYNIGASSFTALDDYSPGQDSLAFGDVKELPNGNFHVTYSTTSTIHEISPSLELLREIETNALLGYVEYRPTLYGPPPPFDR